MLTCKVGQKIINTIDHSDSDIRKYSNKGILKCPICNGNMLYRHGKIKAAHFAHESIDDCISILGREPETEEHIRGKQVLYEWLKGQATINNLRLEAWIPETKQRPDLYFEQDGKRFVMEFQCSPISSEYLERHELYRLAGINDIWILGVQKYSDGGKVIEKYTDYYLDSKNVFIYNNPFYKGYKNRNYDEFRSILIHSIPDLEESFRMQIPKHFKLSDFKFDDGKLSFSKNVVDYYCNENNKVIEEINKKIEYRNQIELEERKRIEQFNNDPRVVSINNLVLKLRKRYSKLPRDTVDVDWFILKSDTNKMLIQVNGFSKYGNTHYSNDFIFEFNEDSSIELDSSVFNDIDTMFNYIIKVMANKIRDAKSKTNYWESVR